MCFQPLTMTCAPPLARRDGRRAPRRHVAARRAPQLLAGRQIERRDKRALLHVGLDDHAVAVDDRRAGEPPLRVGHHEEAGVEQAEVLLPDRLALHVEGVQPFGAEERHDVAAVGGERRAGVGRLGVPLDLRHAGVRGALPERLAGLPCRSTSPSTDAPLVVRRLDVAVEADLETRGGGAADRAWPVQT